MPTRWPKSSRNAVSLSIPYPLALSHIFIDFHRTDKELLVFKSTENYSQVGHATDTKCKPDFAAAFESHWTDPKKNITPWSRIQCVGEDASKGKNCKSQEGQANSYLHYLLLARPDLHVAQGVFISKSNVIFLFGIGGFGIRSLTVNWESEDLQMLAYAFFYRLYDPGRFSDPSYIGIVPHPEDENLVAYTVKIKATTGDGRTQDIEVPNLIPLYATSPFGTRTHIFSNPDPTAATVEVDGKPLAVLKEQLCRHPTRFDEHGILSRVHCPESVPGVIEEVYHELLEAPFCDYRKKYRMGLRDLGKPFMTIHTVQQMLEIVFDILEGDLSPLLTLSCVFTRW